MEAVTVLLTAQEWAAIESDPTKDKAYQLTALGPSVTDYLSRREVEGLAGRTLDTYERDLARLCVVKAKAAADITTRDLLEVLVAVPDRVTHPRPRRLPIVLRQPLRRRHHPRRPGPPAPHDTARARHHHRRVQHPRDRAVPHTSGPPRPRPHRAAPRRRAPQRRGGKAAAPRHLPSPTAAIGPARQGRQVQGRAHHRATQPCSYPSSRSSTG